MANGGKGKGRARQDGGIAVYSGPLVLQSCARGDGTTRRQLRKARKDGWTDARRALFLQVLAATCNVREGCRAAGLHYSSAYDLRQRDPAFAEAWDDAIEQSYCELEMRMLRDCLHGAERVEVIREGHGPMARVKATKTVTAVPHAIALRLLQAHRATVEARRAARLAALQNGQQGARPDAPDVVARMKAEMDAMAARYAANRAMIEAQARG